MSARTDEQSEMYQRIGARIEHARRVARLTQHELASALGLTRPAVANMERGRGAIMLHNLVIIAKTCGTTLGAMLDDERPTRGRCAVCLSERAGRRRAENKIARIAAIANAGPR